MSSMVVITAAGGNGTAIEIIDDPITRMEYSIRGRLLGENAEKLGAEQAGFIVLSQGHFEMAGGEFCGNASRAAAVLFSELRNARDVSFTVSGFKGVVHATVDKRADGKYSVYCRFPGMSVDIRSAKSRGRTVDVVDLGGIVHVVIEDKFPAQQDAYQEMHHRLTEELNLRERDAVGVVWVERKGDSVEIYPVVWVRSVNTFFYESSCGSGTIAVCAVTGVSDIVQPTGKIIRAEINDDLVSLKSDVEVIYSD
jgi:histidine racemase